MKAPRRPLSRPAINALAAGPAIVFTLLLIPQPLFFAPQTWPSFYTDDFYYYVVIAQNLLHHGLSSFDGVTPTNGYHPLWMVLVAVLLGLGGGSPAFFVLLVGVQLLAYAAAIWQLVLILERERAPPAVLIATTLIFTISFDTAAISGMEVILAVPLILAFIAEAQRGQAPGGLRGFRFGLAASAAILARVDALILVGMVGLAVLPALWTLMQRRAGLLRLALGLLPALLYFCVNLAVFGAVLPISSQAKSLAPPFFFNTVPLARAFLALWQPVIACVITIPAWCILGCALAGLFAWRSCDQAARLRTIICAFPPLFFLLLAVRSDWIIWEWYLYPICVALPFACVTLSSAAYRWNPGMAGRMVVAAGVLLGLVPATLQVAAHATHIRPASNAMFTQAIALRPFIIAHPGAYAMGDQAGMVTFLSGAHVFQLEGLVEDRALLDDIARRAPLLSVLRTRHVDYYIGTEMQQDKGCWLGFEPKIYQAGPLSPEMAGRFCKSPVFGVKGTGNGHTMIFAVAAEDL